MKVKSLLNISGLLFKKLSSTISEKEQKELSEWINQDKEHSEITSRILSESRLKSKINSHSQYDTNLAYEKFLGKITKTRKIRMVSHALRIAASIAILITISVLVYNNVKTLDKYDYAKKIEPGEKKALLILADNKHVNLTEEETSKIETYQTIINNELGQIEYKEKEEPGEEVSLKYNTLVISKGREYQLVLSDGTKVFLNADSKLKYPEKFLGDERRIYLESGEIHLEVAHNKSKPFIVETKDYHVNVLGTTFNMSHYDNDQMVHTTLVEGEVEISSITGTMDKKIRLKPEQQLVFNKRDLSTEVKKIDTELYTAWTKGYLIFENETLDNIFKKLERWYDLDVFFAQQNTSDKTFSGRLPKFEDFNVILEMLETIDDVEFDVNEKTIVIKKS